MNYTFIRSGPMCNLDLDFCKHNNPCRNGATCTSGEACGPHDTCEYTCHCAPGFTGKNCERRVRHLNVVAMLSTTLKVDACETAPCAFGSTCYLTANDGYECLCPPGMNGRHCDEPLAPHFEDSELTEEITRTVEGSTRT